MRILRIEKPPRIEFHGKSKIELSFEDLGGFSEFFNFLPKLSFFNSETPLLLNNKNAQIY